MGCNVGVSESLPQIGRTREIALRDRASVVIHRLCRHTDLDVEIPKLDDFLRAHAFDVVCNRQSHRRLVVIVRCGCRLIEQPPRVRVSGLPLDEILEDRNRFPRSVSIAGGCDVRPTPIVPGWTVHTADEL